MAGKGFGGDVREELNPEEYAQMETQMGLGPGEDMGPVTQPASHRPTGLGIQATSALVNRCFARSTC